MSDFDDIIPEFIAESTDLLEEVESGLLQMESGSAQEETVHTIFRAIHSIKGGAGFVGLHKIESLAHKMEDLLNLIRNGDLDPSQAVIDALLQSLDVLSTLFERVEEHQDIDIEAPIAALDASLLNNVSPEIRAALCNFGHSVEGADLPYFEINQYTLEQKLNQGNLFCLRLKLNQMEQRGMPPMQLVNELLSMGEIMDSTIVDMQDGDSDNIEVGLAVLYSTILDPDLMAAAINLEESDYSQVSMGDFDMACALDVGMDSPPVMAAAPTPAPAAPSASAAPPAPAAGSTPAPAAPAEPPQAQTQPDGPPAPQVQAAQQAVLDGPEAEFEEEQEQSTEYLTFMLEDKTYAVDILRVQEIIGLPRLTRLPCAPQHVLGVINLRGMVVPVQDMRLRLGLPVNQDNEPVVVVVLVGDKTMGAVVDAVSDVVQIDLDNIQEPPDNAGAIKRDYLRGLCRYEQELIILLELDKLLAPENQDYAA
jgi:chemotaxis signal transduction protein/HPt (histidine-containing phosphotransfer) domain-containing protein